MANPPLIEISDLCRVFQRDSTEIWALRDINLKVFRGEFISLMGPSGSGKSTLLNIIAGIDRPSSGEAKILGVDLSSLSEDKLAAWRNEHIGFVFQHFNLLPVLTAYENVELPLLLTSLNEGTPVAIVEAMASRVPVIATDVGGVGDLIQHGNTGFLSDVNDDEQMKNNILSLFEDEKLAGRMVASAETFARNTYGYHRLVQDIDALYGRALSR